MEKNRKTTALVIAALVVSVISLGVAFAAFSSRLNINGSATIASSTWDIHYSETNDGAAPSTSATITPTTRTGNAASNESTLTANLFTWSGSFRSPGDTLEYRFYIVNNGDYNANLQAPTVSAPTCAYTDETTPAPSTCPITYTVTKDGTTAFTDSDSLPAHSSQLVVVKATLNSDYGSDNGSALFGKEVTVSTSTVSFYYTQDGPAVTN